MDLLSENAERLPPFRKSESHEQALREMNAFLAPLEESLPSSAAPTRPIVFVIGPPASGTTFAAQLLTATGVFDYISNSIARFWMAPTIGCRISRVIDPLPDSPPKFESVNGSTQGSSGHHEFGYFWNRWFDLGQETHHLSATELARVDATGLKRALARLEAAGSRPLIFKNNTWCTFQAGFLAQILPTSRFVVCHRDDRFVAQSLYRSRQSRYGDVKKWWSIRPRNFAELQTLEPLAQVAAQAVSIARETTASAQKVDSSRVWHWNYRELCNDPRRMLREFLAEFAPEEADTVPFDHIPESFESRDTVTIEAPEFEKIEACVQQWHRENGTPPQEI